MQFADHDLNLTNQLDRLQRANMIQEAARDVAAAVKELLDELGLVGWPKTSGNRGIHIYVRLLPEWDYYEVSWATIDHWLWSSAVGALCATNGANTVGAENDFLALASLDSYHPTLPDVGEVILLFSETKFKFQTSLLDPTTVGLFRQSAADTLVEFATGMDATAQFQYRTTQNSSYQNSVSGSSLANIDAVRIVSEVKEPAPVGIKGEIRFGWSTNIALRNVR